MLKDFKITGFSCHKCRSQTKSTGVLLSGIGVDRRVPEVVHFASEQLLVVPEHLDYRKVTSLRGDVEARGSVGGWLVGNVLAAELFDDVGMPVERSVVERVEPLVVCDLPGGHFVLDDHLRYDLGSEAAGQHQGRYAVTGYWKVHVDVVVYSTKVEQVLVVVRVDGPQYFLLLRAQLVVCLCLLLQKCIFVPFLDLRLFCSCHLFQKSYYCRIIK